MDDTVVTAERIITAQGIWVNGSLFWAPEMHVSEGHVVGVRYRTNDPTVVGVYSATGALLYNAYTTKDQEAFMKGWLYRVGCGLKKFGTRRRIRCLIMVGLHLQQRALHQQQKE